MIEAPDQYDRMLSEKSPLGVGSQLARCAGSADASLETWIVSGPSAADLRSLFFVPIL